MKKLLTIKQASEYLSVSTKTLRRWEKNGSLIPYLRTSGNQRRYTLSQLKKFFKPKHKPVLPPPQPHPIPSPKKPFFLPKMPAFLPHFLVLAFFALLATRNFGPSSVLRISQSFERWLNLDKPGDEVKGKISGQVLSATEILPDFELQVNVPANFNDVANFNDTATFSGGVVINESLTAPNIIYSVSAGNGISVSSGQRPIIGNTGVLSLQEETGALEFTAGGGISIDGLEISNSDKGTSVNVFKTIEISGQDDVVADGNTDTLTLIAGGGISLSTDDDDDEITFTSTTGWTDDGTAVRLSTVTDSVGIGTASPSTKLHVVGNTTLAGTLNATGATALDGNVTLGDAATDSLTFTGRVATGTNLSPINDLGADLGQDSLRFNNLYVANINSNQGIDTAGQATFTYEPTDTTYLEASVIINPTAPTASGALLGVGVAGYERGRIDAEGDIILGYNDAVSAPATDYPLTVYGHNGTNVAYIDTSGNAYFAGNVTGPDGGVIGYWQRAEGAIAPKNITDDILTGATATSSALIKLTGTSGNNSWINTGNLGIGTTSPSALLDLVSTSTSFTANSLLGLDWSPSSATTNTGDLLSLNIGSYATLTGNLLALYDNSSDIFKVNTAQITSAVPHYFSATGDVSIAYDIVLTNPTAAYLTYNGPGYIRTDHPADNYDLTLSAANSGYVIVNDRLVVDQDDTDDTALDIDVANVSGDVINLDWNAATTLTEAMTGLDLDFTNVTADATNEVYGLRINDLAAVTNSVEYGLYQQGTNWDYGAYFEDLVYFDAGATLGGTTPTLTIGDADEEDTTILFDGAEQDFHIGLNDSLNDLVIGTGSTLGASNLITIENGGNVGIGTTAPETKFHLASGDLLLSNNQGIYFEDSGGFNRSVIAVATNNTLTLGSSTTLGQMAVRSAGIMAFFGQGSTETARFTDTGVFFNQSGADFDFLIEGDNNEELFFVDAGNDLVGIGTTAPASELQIAGTTPLLTIGDADEEDTAILFDGAEQDFHIGLDDSLNDLVIGTGSTLGASNLITIENGGNVGIGTTGPSALLSVGASSQFQVNSTGDITTSSTGELTIGGTDTSLITGKMRILNNDTLADPTGDAGNGTRLLFSTANNPYAIGIGAVDGSQYPMWFQTGDGNGGGFEWYIGTSEKMRIDKNGNVGIGTTAPAGKLHVATNTTTLTGQSALIVDQLESEDIMTASASGTPKFALDNSGSAFLGSVPAEAGANHAGVCFEAATKGGATLYQLVDCSDTPADLAEFYPATGGLPAGEAGTSPSLPQPGEIVSIGDPLEYGEAKAFLVERSGEEYDPKMIGVVSTKAFQIMGEDVLEWTDEAVAVGLVGRLPVKIAASSAPIEPGDFLTSSAEPGKAKKAEKEGYVIGKALEKWFPDSQAETILVYLNQSVNLGRILADGELANSTSQESPPAGGATSEVSNLEERVTLLEALVFPETEASESADLLADTDTSFDPKEQVVIEKDLTVLGKTTLADLGVAGNLNIGLLTIEGLSETGASVQTLSGPLQLQPDALGNLEIMGGKAVFDTQGNLKLNQGVLAANEQMRGSEKVVADQNSLRISKQWEQVPASVNTTPSWNTTVWVTDLDATGFTINFGTPPTEEKQVYWLAIW